MNIFYISIFSINYRYSDYYSGYSSRGGDEMMAGYTNYGPNCRADPTDGSTENGIFVLCGYGWGSGNIEWPWMKSRLSALSTDYVHDCSSDEKWFAIMYYCGGNSSYGSQCGIFFQFRDGNVSDGAENSLYLGTRLITDK